MHKSDLGYDPTDTVTVTPAPSPSPSQPAPSGFAATLLAGGAVAAARVRHQ